MFARKYEKTGNGLKERLIIKKFASRDKMFEFLATGSNSLQWAEITHFPHRTMNSIAPDSEVTKAGTYVFAGDKWRNVKDIDPSALAHM